MKRFLSIVFAMMVAIMMITAPAASETGTAHKDAWQFDFTPYLWLAGVEIDVDSDRFAADGEDIPFSDIFDNLNAAFMGTFEARKNRWGIVADGMYIGLSGTAETPSSLIGDVETDLNVGLLTVVGAYRAVEKPFALDILAGARWMALSVDLSVGAGQYPQIMPGRSASDDQNWVDGIVGIRALFPMGDSWSLVGYADVGAGDSDFDFQLIGGVNFEVSKHFVVKGGYRFLRINPGKVELIEELTLKGPYLGLGILF